jgi:sulfopyruvate decarboxylase subunit alpha
MKQNAARLIAQALKENEVRFIAVLPDDWLAEVYQLISKDSYFRVVPVTHEGEGFSMCAGAWCGGVRAALLMENSGLRSAAEPIGRLYEYPVLLLMSYRGDLGDRAHFARPIGKTTEPILSALSIPYQIVRKDAEIVRALQDAVRSLDTAQGSVALLFSGEVVR